VVSDTIFFNVSHPAALSLYPYNRGTIGLVAGFRATFDYYELPVPKSDDQRRLTLAAGEYQILARVGDSISPGFSGERWGQISLADGHTLLCPNLAGSAFIPISRQNREGYLLTGLACWPSVVSKLYVRLNSDPSGLAAESGDVLEAEQLGLESANGLWYAGAGSVTPWQTDLIGERFEPETGPKWPEAVSPLSAYLGRQANPYDYGGIIEIIPQPVGVQVVKHYALGRAGFTQALVMPDRKTVYLGSDGPDRALFKFIAEVEGDLRAGSLYAAKVTQNGPNLILDWLKLGSGNDAETQATMKDLGLLE
jgi:hypothetical protein